MSHWANCNTISRPKRAHYCVYGFLANDLSGTIVIKPYGETQYRKAAAAAERDAYEDLYSA